MTYQEFRRLAASKDEFHREYKAGSGKIDLLDYENIRSGFFYRLVSIKGNEELLQRSPHVLFYDMAITFRLLFHEDEEGISSALIERRHLDYWEIEEEELIVQAVRNTPELFPCRMSKILEMLHQWIDLEGPDLPLFVLTNRIGINGASVIFYQDVLERLGREFAQGIYILPSSIHEVLLIGEKDVPNPKDLRDMVREVNDAVVTPKEFLSNQVLYYNPKNQDIEIAYDRK